MNQSPFLQQQMEILPKVLRPLVYCDFRVETVQDYVAEVEMCATFACEKIEGMKFCVGHAKVIKAAIAAEDGVSG